MKKRITIIVTVLIVATMCALALSACQENADYIEEVKSKLQSIASAVSADAVTEVKTAEGDLIYRTTSKYVIEGDAATVNTVVEALNEDNGIGTGGEIYKREEQTESLSKSDVLVDILSNLTFDVTYFAEGYTAERNESGITLKFGVVQEYVAQFLGISQEEADTVYGVNAVIVATGDKITSVQITYNTNKGNVVRIDIAYAY